MYVNVTLIPRFSPHSGSAVLKADRGQCSFFVALGTRCNVPGTMDQFSSSGLVSLYGRSSFAVITAVGVRPQRYGHSSSPMATAVA